MRLILDKTTIKFEPEFKDFEIVLLNVYDVIIKAVSLVPRVETKLYSEWVRKVYQMCTRCKFVKSFTPLILLKASIEVTKFESHISCR